MNVKHDPMKRHDPVAEFAAFWQAYPRRVKRPIAEKAFLKARSQATFEEIMAGVETYKRNKPDYADWAHPSSWLNAGRWMDEYDEPAPRVEFPDCDHEPRCNSKVWCRIVRERAQAKEEV